jgi:hypothetical protein
MYDSGKRSMTEWCLPDSPTLTVPTTVRVETDDE